MQPRTFRAPKGVESFKTITIREVTGQDELDAAEMATIREKQTGKKNWPALLELVRLSIVDVDSKPVGGAIPFTAFDHWPSRDRNVVTRFFNVINAADEDDLGKAIEEAEPKTPSQSPSEASSPQPSGG